MSAQKLPRYVVNELALAADVDPRTIAKVYSGGEVRTASARRARLVLVQAGFYPAGETCRPVSATIRRSDTPDNPPTAA